MPGRHQVVSGVRPRLRLLVGGFAAMLAAATGMALFAANASASSDPVNATFSITGVSTSGCPVSVGGSEVYVKPGQELDVKSSVVGATVAGVPLDLSAVAGFTGALTIDANTSHKRTFKIATSTQKINLPSGDHSFRWDVQGVQLFGVLGNVLPAVPLSLNTSDIKAGASLDYTGTIHVTSAKNNCGVAIQIPGVSASASVPGLPPVNVGLPGAKVTLLQSVPNIKLPSIPGLGGKTTPPAGGSDGTTPASGGQLPVPAQIVPGGYGNGSGLTGGYVPNVLPGSIRQLANGSNLLPVSGSGNASSKGNPASLNSSGKHKTVNLASNKASTGQLSVVLAIIAVIVLSMVSAMYARLYLMRR